MEVPVGSKKDETHEAFRNSSSRLGSGQGIDLAWAIPGPHIVEKELMSTAAGAGPDAAVVSDHVAAGFLVDVAKNAVLGSAKHGEVHNMAIEFPVFTFGQIAALTSGNLPTMKRYYFDLRDGDALGGARWKRPGPDSEAHV